jgi:hypothetical protein
MLVPSNFAEIITVPRLKEIARDVRELSYKVGHDSTGDPAVYITVVLSDKATDRAILQGKYSGLESWIRQKIWDEGGHQYWPYVTLRRKREIPKAVGA